MSKACENFHNIVIDSLAATRYRTLLMRAGRRSEWAKNERFSGRRLRAHRLLLKWSLTDLAAQVGVTVSHLSRVERDERDPGKPLAGKIAEVFGVPVENFIEEPDNEAISA